MRRLVIAAMLLSAHAAAIPVYAEDVVVVVGELGNQLDAYMRPIAEQGYSGVLLVAKDGEIVISKGYGLADREQQRPFTSETVFDIGSVTKQFTAAGVLHLEQNGKLSVTDPIGKYFGDVPTDKSAITLHHLLTHSSGLQDGFGDDYEVQTRDSIVRAALDSKLLWEPGTRYRYSNAGYSLLGAIIEIVSGQSYEAYLNEHLFVPAGMKQTGYVIPQWNRDLLAHGYRKGDQDTGTPLDHLWAEDGPYWNLKCNGGILSTVSDLYRWHQALLGETILTNAQKEKLFARHVKEGPNARTYYGYGWSIAETSRGTKLITHNGGNGIFYANFRRYVEDDVVMIVGSNQSGRTAERYEGAILGLIFPPKRDSE